MYMQIPQFRAYHTHTNLCIYIVIVIRYRGRRDRDQILVGFTTASAISVYHH